MRVFPILLLVFACACATTAERRRGPALTNEADEMLRRALAEDSSSGLVIDLAALEKLGFDARNTGVKESLELISATLPLLSSAMPPDEQAMFARVSVATAVLREWAEWPSVRGIGMRLFRLGEPGVNPLENVVLVTALAQGEDENRELFRGLLVLARAVAAGEGGDAYKLEMRGGDACVVPAEGDVPWCVRSGKGFILMGAPDAMTRYVSAPFGDRPDAPVLMRARVSVPQQGTVHFRMSGSDAVQVVLEIDSKSPVLLAKAESAMQEIIKHYDDAATSQRARVERALAEMKRDVGADPDAPTDLKKELEKLTPDTVSDPHGYWAQTRASLKSQRTQGRYLLSFEFPAGAVEKLAEVSRGGGGAAYGAGVLAAVAVPNFMKFQCRAKQSEVKTQLKAAFVAQRAWMNEKDQWGRTFEEIGFSPEPNSRYTYCMGEDCIPCTHAECKRPPENPCAGMSGVGRTIEDGFQVCAYGNVDDDPKQDIWLIDDSGEPEVGENDCE